MKCFRLVVTGEDHPHETDGEFDESKATFLVHREVWQAILRIANLAGALGILNSQMEMKCGVCDSFLVSAESFLEFINKTEAYKKEDDLFFELVQENLWHIYQALVETKFNNDEAFLEYYLRGGDDYRLLRDEHGELIYDESSGWPLGLAYEYVVIKINPVACLCCSRIFGSD